MRSWIGLVPLLMVSPGCEDHGTSGRVCTTEARAGIQVEVRDALSGEPAAQGAVGIAYDGAYADTLQLFPNVPPHLPLTLIGAVERPGVYTVVVRKSGYRDWIRAGVEVRHDGCHVITVKLEARLEPVG